jgi:DNA-directed RNA polymerase
MLFRLLNDPHQAGRHMAAWPLLLHFADRGPRNIIAVVLGVVINNISRRDEVKKLAMKIGAALQNEAKAVRIHQKKGAVLMATLKKHFGKKAVRHEVMSQLKLDPSGWTAAEKREVGLLLIEVIAASTDLIELETVGKRQLVGATDAARELIAANPPLPLPVRALPCLVPPEPWEDVTRGGRRLVSSRQPMDLSHVTRRSAGTAIDVANVVEQQQLVLDPWMVEVQRQAWDQNLPVFKVLRETEDGWSMVMDAEKRARVEEVLRQAEEVKGLPIWLEHDFDFRGRLYCSSRMAGHQGPDHQKAMLSFAQREVVTSDGFDQMLMAAAGHHSLSRSSWEDRLAWGKDHLRMLQAIAHNPLDLIDLWRDASDPWQFVQLAKAIGDHLDGETDSGVPIRFDQTCSGLGIIAALTRDEALGRTTNLTGDTRHDIYQEVAAEVHRLVESDLHGFDFAASARAERWLQVGIDRALCKGPVMTTIYGARHFGIVEQLVNHLQAQGELLPVGEWERGYTWPAQYMARKLGLVIGARLKSCIALEKWLRDVSQQCVKKQQRIRWQSPMGFPVSLGSEVEQKQRHNTVLHGRRRWRQHDVDYEPGMLSAVTTNRGVTANTIHTFDAALCQAVILRCAQMRAPVLTNHDCFATTPHHADWLHTCLLRELREMYRPDWLAEMRVEISRNAGLQLPHPPMVGTLREGAIGQNPYCFS